MKSRPITVVLVAAAAVIYACGPRPHAAEATRERAVAAPGVASSLDVSVKGEVAIALHVTNNGARSMELTFPNGQTHDFVVLDSIGREVWRWSNGRMFTQALQNHVLDGNETMTYEASWSPPRTPGRYTAVASLMSENHPVERRVEFAVP